MRLPKELEKTQTLIEKYLRKFFQEKRSVARAIDPFCEILVEQIADLTLRPAKRIRPFLVELGYRAVDSGNPEDSRNLTGPLAHAMLAVELFHAFALIHDDIMDQDVVRRGGPAIHVQAGINIAILAGDLALVWADECMNKTGHGKAIELFSRMKEEISFGQTLDIMKQAGNKNIAQEKINEMKTAWYTVVRPLQIGAALAGASDKTLTALVRFGVPVGKLFQLKDDLLDREITQKDFDDQTAKLQEEARLATQELNQGELFGELVQFVTERSV